MNFYQSPTEPELLDHIRGSIDKQESMMVLIDRKNWSQATTILSLLRSYSGSMIGYVNVKDNQRFHFRNGSMVEIDVLKSVKSLPRQKHDTIVVVGELDTEERMSLLTQIKPV